MNERLTKELLALVDAFQAVRPLTDVTLSKYCAGDSRFVPDLRRGAVAVSGVRYDNVVAWFSANAPGGMKWPRGVARPRPQSGEPRKDKRPAVA